MSLGFPRPTPVVLTTLITLLAVFIVSAIGYRFAAGRAVYETLALHPHPQLRVRPRIPGHGDPRLQVLQRLF